MADMFISYTAVDEVWGEWIAYTLEEADVTVVLQKWDFRPGTNFVLEMQKAAATCERTIIVMSPDYLKSAFAASEWAAAFASDPKGEQRALVPVIVRDCQVPGLLKSVVHISLIDADELTARERLMSGVLGQRAKPSQRPKFPGGGSRQHAAYPGAASARAATRSVGYMPRIKRAASDLEKRDFLDGAFTAISEHFRVTLIELGKAHRQIEVRFETKDNPEFRVELFAGGRYLCACKAWIGDELGGMGICYAEGRTRIRGSACNEILSLVEDGGELYLHAMMDMGIRFQNTHVPLDTKQMTPEQAADYLWRRFVVPLEA